MGLERPTSRDGRHPEGPLRPWRWRLGASPCRVKCVYVQCLPVLGLVRDVLLQLCVCVCVPMCIVVAVVSPESVLKFSIRFLVTGVAAVAGLTVCGSSPILFHPHRFVSARQPELALWLWL